MSSTALRATTAGGVQTQVRSEHRMGALVVKLLTTTDHKVLGQMYVWTALAYFGFAGLLALAIRAELAFPGLQYLSYETFNQFFTMHGTLMLLMFATPMFAAFANALMPLQIGAPDVAFPRMNAFSYWVYFFGSLIAVSGFLSPEGAASFGWFAYAPLSNAINSPGVGGDLCDGLLGGRPGRPRRVGRIENPAATSAMVPARIGNVSSDWKCSRCRMDEKPERSRSEMKPGNAQTDSVSGEAKLS